MNRFILICLLAHILGDYYFQWQKLSEKKNEKYKWLLVHSGLYAIPYIMLSFLLLERKKYLLPFTIIIGLHWFLDTVKWLVNRKITKSESTMRNIVEQQQKEEQGEKIKFRKKSIYVIDQFLHLITILVVAICFKENIEGTVLESFRTTIHSMIHISITDLTKVTILIFVLYRPVNITFVQIFSDFAPEENEEIKLDVPRSNMIIKGAIKEKKKIMSFNGEVQEIKNTNTKKSKPKKKAGGYIGLFERIIIVVLLYLEAYSAIGFVLTAKSVARYDNIVKDQRFAEYFLIGTLYSTASTLIFYGMLHYIL